MLFRIVISPSPETRAARNWPCWRGVRPSRPRLRNIPRTPFIGVRISWLIIARNSDLARSAASACLRASAWAVTSPLHSFFGMLVDRTKSYDIGLVIAGLAPWIGVLAMRLLWRKTDEPSPT